ncbi:unnamed protein product [Rhizophagus irregularis]|nr:unnamed protein product [Rhizophagus irregularis]
MDSVQFIPLIASYLIIIGTVSKLCEIIIKVSYAANYNKVTCKVLNKRVQIISGVVELLKRSQEEIQLFDKVYRDAFEEYLFTLNSIKRHISNISEIHGFRKYSKAISISERFMVLTKNYESAMKDLQFALIVANEERRKEDIYGGDRFLAEIHSGVFGNYKHLRQIDERVVILADEIKNIRNFLGEENFHGQKGANADILTEQECADADILTEQEGVDADILTEAENYRIFFDEEWIRKKDFESLVMELKVLREVSCHKNIISFLGISKDNGYVVVLEYANEGNLREYLTKKFKSLEWEKKIQMALDITSGLNFLHSKGIIHRDLHSKNILVNDGELLIADFGFSERLTEVTSNSTEDRDMLGYQISHNNLREDPIEGTPLEYQLLYQECWDDDPAKRPNIDQVYKEIFRLCNVNCTYEQEDSLAVASTSAPNIGGLNSLNNQLDQSDRPDLCLSDNWIGSRNESVIVDINQS